MEQREMRDAPCWAWQIIDQTLRCDAESSAFTRDLRQDIRRALAAMQPILPREEDKERERVRAMARKDARSNGRTSYDFRTGRMGDGSVPRTRAQARRAARLAREYWDAYESGRPMSDDDR